MPIRLKFFTFIIGISLFIFIIELVRRRKMREEYSLFWLLSGLLICVLSVWYEAIVWIAAVIGSAYPPSVLFFFGLVFLAFISIFYSVKLSDLSNKMKNLSQKIAMMEIENKAD